jgi:two-component system, NarL family, response regulator LiaR
VFSPARDGKHRVRVPETIRVALVNDYQIVLEGLRALLRPYDPEIKVVELDVEGNPHSAVDVTLFDTYGEVQELRQRVRGLAADATNGAIVVFSFSDDAALAGTFCVPAPRDLSPKHCRQSRLSTASGRSHVVSASC